MRVLIGVLMMLCGFIGLHGTPLGWGVAAVGLISLVTSLIRYCPACALSGRRSDDDCRGA